MKKIFLSKLINLIIFGIAVVAVIGAGILGMQHVKESLKSQEINNLQDVANQNAIVMEKELTARLDMLTSISAMMRSRELPNDERILQTLKDVPAIYGLKRIGFVRPNGTAFTTDGYEQDLSFREFFVSSMRGNRYVSKRVINSLGDAVPINIFSVPVYADDSKRVVGVLFATYETNSFRKIIEVPSFAGSGYCFVVDAVGNVIIDSEKSPLVGAYNLVDAWSNKGFEAKNLARDIQSKLLAKQTNFATIESEGQEKLVYYLPLKTAAHENTLYLLTIVPANALINRLMPIANVLKLFLACIIGVITISVGYIFYSIYRRDKDLYELAYVDALTKDMNYIAFKEQWKHTEHINGFIVAFDIHRFSNIGQLLGNERANEVLLGLWKFLKSQLGANEMLARVEQDEFVLLLCATSPYNLEQRIEKLGEGIANLYKAEGIPELHGVFGVYAAQEVSDVDAAYNCAVIAKNTIKGRYQKYCSFYNDINVAEAKEQQKLVDSFSEAIANEEFDVAYQPKVCAATEQVIGAEALVRWRKKDGSMLSPAKFIPVFEANGMIAILDEYVFKAVCKQQHAWLAAGKTIVPISVNLSRASLQDKAVVDRYVSIAQQYAIEPQYLEIEITEGATAAMNNLGVYMQRFHEAGFKLLLDDFGSGYSSLVALYKLPFDVLKLDKSLIDYIEEAKGGRLVHQMIGYAQSLGMTVTAEGVESKSQLELLRTMNCDDIQGYYFDKPLMKGKFAEKYL